MTDDAFTPPVEEQEDLDSFFEACSRLRQVDLEDDWTLDWRDDYGPP